MNDRASRLMRERSSAQARIATSEDVAELRTLASSCADEARKAKDQLARLRSIHANLLAAGRAAIAAHREASPTRGAIWSTNSQTMPSSRKPGGMPHSYSPTPPG
jgi:hypothetical protein